MALSIYRAYNGVPNPIPTGDVNPCVGLNIHVGILPTAGKPITQIAEMQSWRDQCNGRLLSRLRFDVSSKPFTQGWHEDGWQPRFIARMPLSEWEDVRDAWINAGYSFSNGLVDEHWLDAVQAVDPKTAPVPYVTYVDPATHLVTLGHYVLDLRIKLCRAWIVSAALALRAQLGRHYLGVDGFEASLKSKFWRWPQDDRGTPENGRPGAITDTPYRDGQFEKYYEMMLTELHEAGFKMLVTEYPRKGDEPGDWLDPAVAENLLGHWRPLPQP